MPGENPIVIMTPNEIIRDPCKTLSVYGWLTDVNILELIQLQIESSGCKTMQDVPGHDVPQKTKC